MIFEDLRQFLTLADPNVRYVVIGLVLLGAGSGLTGSFAFLQKRSLVGDAVSHAILPGVAAAFLITQGKNPVALLIGAFAAGWLSLVCMDIITRHSKLKKDAATGIILSVFFGFGIVLLTYIQQTGNASQSGLDTFLLGKAAALLPIDIYAFGIGTVLIIVISILFFKGFKVMIFDPGFARSIGFPVQWLEFLITTLTVLAIVIGIQAVGVVLMAAMLITPATAARFWVHSLRLMMILAAAIGAFSGLLGAFVSYTAPNMPTGPWMVLSASLIAGVSFLFAPGRGLVAKSLKRRQSLRHVRALSLMADFMEKESPSSESTAFDDLLNLGWVNSKAGRLTATEKGIRIFREEFGKQHYSRRDESVR